MSMDVRKNTYTINVNGNILKDFEFIVGPMIGVNLSSPPYKPVDFIKGCFEGGATPIGSSRYFLLEQNLGIFDQFIQDMGDRYYGVNLLCLWTYAKEFLDELKKRQDDFKGFIDLNAVEVVMADFLPLLRDIRTPLFMGIHYPMSIAHLKKLLQQPEHFHIIDRIASGKLTLYIPRNVGGGHLPAVTKEQMEKNSVDEMIAEIISLEKAIGHPVPFVIEKGMMTVDDFVEAISDYSRFPSFKGVRFASNLLLSNEISLNPKLRALLKEIVLGKKSEMIIPIRSQLGAERKGDKVRGGVLMWAIATDVVRKLHEQQCNGADFPKLRRPYSKKILERQAERTDKFQTKVCKHCHKDCPREICAMQLSWHSLEDQGLLDEASVTVSPKIINLDHSYIDAPAQTIVNDLITKTIARLKMKSV